MIRATRYCSAVTIQGGSFGVWATVNPVQPVGHRNAVGTSNPKYRRPCRLLTGGMSETVSARVPHRQAMGKTVQVAPPSVVMSSWLATSAGGPGSPWIATPWVAVVKPRSLKPMPPSP
jgi:hypothetical protein